MADDEQDRVEVPLTWIGVEDMLVLTANQIVVQFAGTDEFILGFGQVAPPILLGGGEERREQLREVTFAAVRPVARLGLTRQRIEELIRVLTENLERRLSVPRRRRSRRLTV
jgi:hypothetical protein